MVKRVIKEETLALREKLEKALHGRRMDNVQVEIAVFFQPRVSFWSTGTFIFFFENVDPDWRKKSLQKMGVQEELVYQDRKE